MAAEATLSSNGYQILRKIIPKEYIDDIRITSAKLLGSAESVDEILLAMESLERKSPQSFYEFCLKLGNSCAAQRVAFITTIYKACAQVFEQSGCWLVDSAVFFNKREVKRLQYDWHVEKSYFPNAVNAVTLWFPFLDDVRHENGPMLIANGSKEKSFEVLPGRRQEGHLTQMRITEDQLADCSIVPCTLSVGDAVIFDYNVAHKTSINRSERARVALVMRFSCKAGKCNPGW